MPARSTATLAPTEALARLLDGGHRTRGDRSLPARSSRAAVVLASATLTGYHPGMQHEVGIRRGSGARFVLPGNQRDPRSGLLRLFPVRSQQGQALRAAAATQPVRAIRLAARSAVRPAVPARRELAVLHVPDHTHWNTPRSHLRDPRGIATPWRG